MGSVIKYLGSKRKLLTAIVDAVAALPRVSSVLDLFSGTSRVGHALKGAGYAVVANDHNAYAYTLARTYVEADREEHLQAATQLVAELNLLRGAPGWFTETYCERSRYLHPHNGARVDSIRNAIARKSLSPVLESVLLSSLMEAADRVDSTTGLQMAYLKQWAPRAHRELELRVPDLLPRASRGAGQALNLEAIVAAATAVDVAYLDPPYNQHSYLGNYHVWESLVRWDQPEVYGVACKRSDVRERRSVFNSRPGFRGAFEAVLDALRARFVIVSFSDEGFMGRAEMEGVLGARGSVVTREHDYKRYVGAQIGIHNPQGVKVGAVSHLRNKEFLYVLDRG
jgi:adenine-specific DNA-methyltransferase